MSLAYAQPHPSSLSHLSRRGRGARPSARRLSWYLIAALALADLLALGAASTATSAAGERAAREKRAGQTEAERLYQAQHRLTPEMRNEMLRALLYRSDQPVQTSIIPACNQVELTYGQIDPCH